MKTKKRSYIKEQNKQHIEFTRQMEVLAAYKDSSRISSELQDHLGHTLASIILGLEVVKKDINTNPIEVVGKINHLIEISKNSLEEVKKNGRFFKSAEEESYSLQDQFNIIIEDFQDSTGVQVKFSFIGEEIILPEQIRLDLVYCLQAALTNSIKHGRSIRIGVRLTFETNTVTLEIVDDAEGIETIGYGWNNIKARIEGHNGQISIKKNIYSGFTFSCHIPIRATKSVNKIKLLIIDDQELIRESLGFLLGQEKDFSIVGSASDGRKALELCRRENPDVVLLDIQLPQMDGIQLLKQIKEQWPSMKVIILTTFSDVDFAKEVISYGAEGYLLKSLSTKQLRDSIRLVHRGSTLLSPNLAKSLFSPNDSLPVKQHDYGLTNREMEIVRYLVEDLTYSEIADQLQLARGTVKNYISSIYTKLLVENRAQAVKKIVEEGINIQL